MKWTPTPVDFTRISSIPLSPNIRKIGDVKVTWEEIEPGYAYIDTQGGTPDDRHFAHLLTKYALWSKGYLIAEQAAPCDFHTRIAAWSDVMAKGKRLYEEGNVELLRNGQEQIVGRVKGDDPSTEVEVKDHHRVFPPPDKPQQTYECSISREDPNSASWTQSSCNCKWNEFRHDRNLKFKNLEGRICSHLYALWLASINTPLDEEIHPSPAYRQNPQQHLFTPEPSPEGTATFPEAQPQAPSPEELPKPRGPGIIAPTPGLMPDLTEAPSKTAPYISPQEVSPAQLSLIPPSRQEMADMLAQMPFSQPNPNPPSPDEPFGGQGTFSHIVRSINQYVFQPGDPVRLNAPTYAQKEREEGYSSTGEWMPEGSDAGEWIEIPRNTFGEVVDFDPTTGYIVVDFPLSGPAGSSYHARTYMDAAQVTLVSREPRPTPFIRRR